MPEIVNESTDNTSNVTTDSASTSASEIPGDINGDLPRFERENAWSKFADTEPIAETSAEPVIKPDAADAADKPDTETPETDTETPDEELPAEQTEDEILEEIFSDDELDRENSKDVIKEQGSRRKMAAAKRNVTLAETVKNYQSPDTPIADVIKEFQSLSPGRFAELEKTTAHGLIDTHPEDTFKRAFVVEMLKANPSFDWQTAEIPTLADVIGRFNNPTGDNAVSTQTEDISRLTGELDKNFDFDWRDTANDPAFSDDELQIVNLVRAYEAENAKLSEKEQGASRELAELTAQINQLKTEREKDQQTKYAAEYETVMMRSATEFRQTVEPKLIAQIAKYNGLAPNPEDTPQMKAFKQSRMEMFTGTDFERENHYNSRCEEYAYNASQQKQILSEITGRVIAAQDSAVKAEIAGRKDEAAQFRSLIENERIPFMETMAKASREFSDKYIKPDFELIDTLGNGLFQKQREASRRIEVTGGGASRTLPPVTDADPNRFGQKSAWDVMAEEATRNAQFRSN